MADVLEEICDVKRGHIAEMKAKVSVEALQDRIASTTKPRGFAANLRAASTGHGYGLIAEIKKASPSKGLIRSDFDPPVLARAYQAGGAACLSVLTDAPYFQGEDSFLTAARDAVELPALRKDFMLDAYQVYEARALGADCILVIMAALDDAAAADLSGLAGDLGMDVLVEVHNEAEMERAVALKPALLGINNRNLKTLAVDLAATERLAKMNTGDALLVSESGLYELEDLDRMAEAGVRCFLVGESLMRQEDVAAATRRLLGADTKPERETA